VYVNPLNKNLSINESCFESDVIALGHHGSSTSIYKPFLDAVDADVAVISCGKDNSYGHPHREALDYIDEAMAETNLSQAHLTELAAKASSIQTARTRYIDDILSILYANLKSSGGKSNVEVSARYGALDNLRDIKAKIEELDLMIPDDQEFVGYKEKFNSIIKRYGIKL
jgi:hypothetical protein